MKSPPRRGPPWPSTPGVDTIFEIGGQDSKFIAIENGVVTDFQMNKICAAGTGSFIEEQAKKLGVDLDEIGTTALSGTSPPPTWANGAPLFMESSIASHLGQGTDVADLAAGLCYSIVPELHEPGGRPKAHRQQDIPAGRCGPQPGRGQRHSGP